ncbi:hypothetical protein [Ralstonia pickettii]|uniref:hypothetical protein n=1 Tax=Ralstonia pickettii TaxID=329 RepID=UPI0008189480|nr:hypothetical protein [Ralstonia pickettii]OCS43881.1 hypothetical protein BEK67_01045 [Ralstonia pickettii]
MRDTPTVSTAQARDGQNSKWPASVDPFKLVALLMTLTGVVAWVAGEAYMLGYWGAAHYPRNLSAMSLQSLALLGFYGAYRCWLWGIGAAALSGALIVLTAVRKKKAKREPNWLRRIAISIRRWWTENFEVDGSSAVPGVLLLGTAFCYYAILISPAVLWIFGAYHQGQQLLEKQACQTRAGTALTSMTLADGSMLWGNVIERSDKLIALLTKDALVMVADGDKGARLVESTSLANIECSKN